MADMERRSGPDRRPPPFSGVARGEKRKVGWGMLDRGIAGTRGPGMKGHYLHLTVRNHCAMCHRCSQQKGEGLDCIKEETAPPPFIGCHVTQQQKQDKQTNKKDMHRLLTN